MKDKDSVMQKRHINPKNFNHIKMTKIIIEPYEADDGEYCEKCGKTPPTNIIYEIQDDGEPYTLICDKCLMK